MYEIGDVVTLLPSNECIEMEDGRSPGYVGRQMAKLEGQLLTVSMVHQDENWVGLEECDFSYYYDNRWLVPAGNKD